MILGPDHFKIPEVDPTARPPPPEPGLSGLGASPPGRQARLRARIDQEEALRRALRAAVQATEEATLPILRDALIAAITADREKPAADVAEGLTEQLLIECKASGSQVTTRFTQAGETLQALISGF